MAADAYTVDLSSGTITKNGTLLTNVQDLNLFIRFDFAPGPAIGEPTESFNLACRIHDTAADARILAQGPAGLLGGSVAAFAGKPAIYRLRSKPGDTLTILNPQEMTDLSLEESADGFAP